MFCTTLARPNLPYRYYYEVMNHLRIWAVRVNLKNIYGTYAGVDNVLNVKQCLKFRIRITIFIFFFPIISLCQEDALKCKRNNPIYITKREGTYKAYKYAYIFG